MPATTKTSTESEPLTAAELATFLAKTADSHLRSAKRNGRLGIGRTKLGFLELCWDGSDFSIGGGPNCATIRGKAAVKALLISAYVVLN